ncbi:MAG TPA: hypothetical protein VL946_07250, partial [Lacibacter sp.]|nr:hypothetical protein [Lacibacter sp.]
MMKNNFVLCLLSGLLLVISFPITGSVFPLAFLAWVPLLAIEYHFSDSRFSGWKALFFSYITFFIYNLGTTWWIYYASEDGAMMAFFANSLLMAIAFTIYHILNKLLGRSWWIVSFICVWLTFELLHFHWELSWPWLTLGNIFASSHYLVQWYSVTGVFGGSLWILLINALVFNLIVQKKHKRIKNWVPIAIILFLPIVISLGIYTGKQTTGKKYNVSILQPNVDPYHEKFTGSNTAQLEHLLALANSVNTAGTKLIIAPETALYPNIEYTSDFLVVDKLPYHSATRTIKKYQLVHPIPLLIGGSTYDFFEKEHSPASNYIEPGVYQES